MYHPCETHKISALAVQAGVAEELEQRRRLLDRRGEEHRKLVANEVAHLVTPVDLRHIPAPVEAPLVAAGEHVEAKDTTSPLPFLLNQGLTTLTSVLSSAKHFASSVTQASVDAADAVCAFTQKSADVGSEVARAAVDLTEDTYHKAVDLTGDTYQKAVNAISELGSNAVLAGQEIVASVEYDTDFADVAQDTFPQKTVQFGSVTVTGAEEVVDNLRIADDVVVNKEYVNVVQEDERMRRMVDVDEEYAVLNALAVSDLIKELGPEFYRQSGQKFSHTLSLLEEYERKWRMFVPFSTLSKVRAKEVAALMADYYQINNAVQIPSLFTSSPPTKIEEAEVVQPKPFIPAF